MCIFSQLTVLAYTGENLSVKYELWFHDAQDVSKNYACISPKKDAIVDQQSRINSTEFNAETI